MPKAIPTKVSVGKCTPSTTREKPTKVAHSNSGNNKTGIKKLVIVVTKKAAEVCPDGKLN